MEPEAFQVLPKVTLTFNLSSFLLGVLPFDGRQGEDLVANNLGVYALEYERALTRHLGVYVAPALIRFNRSHGGTLITGFSADAGVRYYFTGQAPTGPWASAGLNARLYGGTYQTTLGPGGEETLSFGAGGMAGYTFLVQRVLDISLGMGGGVNRIAARSVFLGMTSEKFAPVLLVRLNVGFAF